MKERDNSTRDYRVTITWRFLKEMRGHDNTAHNYRVTIT